MTTRSDQPRAHRRSSVLAIAAGIAGPAFVTTIAAQAALHSGFDLSRHPLSLLALGDAGWVQTLNFLLCGAVFATAAGSTRSNHALTRWTRAFIATFGVALIVAGLFPADPWRGYPAGAAEVTTWHGMIHNSAAALGGLALFGATLTAARARHRIGRRTAALGSVAVGVSYMALSVLSQATQDYRIAFAALSLIVCWASITLVTRSSEPQLGAGSRMPQRTSSSRAAGAGA